jgi:hypothetical protein
VDVVVVGLALLALLALVLIWSAGRLDHLHTRVERTEATLDAELLRRCAATLEVATSGMLDPATSMVLADAAHRARRVDGAEREDAESALTQALLVAFDDAAALPDPQEQPWAADLVAELAAATRRVQTARRLHNDTVAVTRSRRRAPFVRLFHLAGRAGVPEPTEFDDRVPAAFAR